MKKIIVLALLATIMVGCKQTELREKTRHAVESITKKPILKNGMIVDLDSCQYVVCDAYGGWAYVHHGNCRFCRERRQKELKDCGRNN